MRALLVGLLVVHGLIHAIGFVKAFELARVEALRAELGRPAGLLWLAAGLGFLVTAALFATGSREWPFVALPALVLSQALIVASWSDAKVGTIANVLVLAASIVGLIDRSPSSLRSTYVREVERGLAREISADVVGERDLATLPGPLQTYLRRAGVVGKPRVHDVRMAWRAQMRSAPDAGWMSMDLEQHSFFDEPTRLFFIQGTMFGVPFVGLHRYANGEATMDVRVLSVLRIVDGRGPKMDQSERVTMFNDMCVFAPAALLDARVTWQAIDERRVRGVYTNGKSTVSAELFFDGAGDLVDFVSDDRLESADGKTYRSHRWSTPLSDYRDFDGHRVAARGDATWHLPGGEFVYGRFELTSIAYNLGRSNVRQVSTLSEPRPGRGIDVGQPSESRPAL